MLMTKVRPGTGLILCTGTECVAISREEAALDITSRCRTARLQFL